MSITRHEIRKISDENRGQPIISQAVVHGNVAYFAGVTPDPIVGDIKTQTAQVLRRVDELLNLAGTDKSHLLSAQVWIADMRLFEDHNSVWNAWVDSANPPARACLTTDFWRPGMLVEVIWEAANILRGSPVDRTDWKSSSCRCSSSNASATSGTRNTKRCSSSTARISRTRTACAKSRHSALRYRLLFDYI